MSSEFDRRMARMVFQRLEKKDEADRFNEKKFSQVLYPLLAEEGVVRESWPFHWREVSRLVKGRIRRASQKFAANDPRRRAEEEELRRQIRNEENQQYWNELAEECNYTVCPID